MMPQEFISAVSLSVLRDRKCLAFKDFTPANIAGPTLPRIDSATIVVPTVVRDVESTKEKDTSRNLILQ